MLQMRGITKRFGSTLANDRIDFAVAAGEIHALLGENGAGKSTLMNLLVGLYRPDAGEIHFEGRPVEIGSPRAAIQMGIGMVHQHPMLVPQLTVAENIVAGLPSRSPFLNLRRHGQAIRELAVRYGFEIDPGQRVGELSIAAQKQVEILKVLYRGARLIVLDEPTDVLPPPEVEAFFVHLRSLVKEGLAVVFISHHLEEVLSLATAITVLRGGRVAGQIAPGEATPAKLAAMMVGELPKPEPRHSVALSESPVLAVEAVSDAGQDGRTALSEISLTVHGGEILGVAGVTGNGQDELVEVICGMRKPTAGRVRIAAVDAHQLGVRGLIERNLLGYVPGERRRDGLAARLDLAENLVVERFRQPVFSRHGILRRTVIEQFAAETVKHYDVRPPIPSLAAGTLSGGNQQKLLIARVLTRAPRLLVVANPTRGLDIGAAAYIRRQLLFLRNRGAGVLVVSSDLEELLELSDRLAVLSRGRLMGVVRPGEVSATEIGLMMGGQRRDG